MIKTLKKTSQTFGFSDQVTLLDYFEPTNTELVKAIVLTKSIELSYYTPSGKARLKNVITYRVGCFELENDGFYNEIDTRKFTTKRDAMAYYKNAIHRTKLSELDAMADKSINYGVIKI